MDSFEQMLAWMDRQWHTALSSVSEIEISELPQQAYNELLIVVDKVTQHGTLTPFTISEKPAAPKPVARVRTSTSALILRDPRETVRRHPIIFSALLTSLIGGYLYLRPPAFFARLPILNAIPQGKRAPSRPRRLTDGTRLDAVLVLGAERGGLGRELAMDLERKGFVVLATVPDGGEVEALERLGRGHIKALVLDPADAGTIPPFLRSLSTSLSLRFPLHTAGDPFRPAHQSPTLCAVINCLALATHCSTSHASALLGPLEATPLAALSDLLQKRVVTSLGVLQGTLPLLRTGPHSSSVITLVPASTSRVALPYVGPQSIADGALTAMTDVLRREVSGSKISVATLDTGFFERSHHGSARHNVGLGTPSFELPPHLRAIYTPRSSGQGPSRRRSEIRKLSDKVLRIIRGSQQGRHGVGAGARTYQLASILPSRLLDSLLGLQQRLLPPAETAPGPVSPNAERGFRRPLPTPPSGNSSSLESSFIQVKSHASSESEGEELKSGA